MDPGTGIENSGPVLTLYDQWPSFHDATVHRLTFDLVGTDAPACFIRMHAFRMTDQVDARGYLVLTDHALISLQFTNIVVEYLPTFEECVELLSLAIDSAVDPANPAVHFKVSMVPAAGSWGIFPCERVIVTGV